MHKRLKEGVFSILVVFAAFLFLTLLTYDPTDSGWIYSDNRSDALNAGGMAGAWFASVLLSLFGWLAWLIPLVIIWIGWVFYRKQDTHINFSIIGIRWLGFILILIAGTVLSAMHVKSFGIPFPEGTGGILGQIIQTKILPILNSIGTTLLSLACLLGGINLFTGLSWLEIMEWIGSKISVPFMAILATKTPKIKKEEPIAVDREDNFFDNKQTKLDFESDFSNDAFKADEFTEETFHIPPFSDNELNVSEKEPYFSEEPQILVETEIEEEDIESKIADSEPKIEAGTQAVEDFLLEQVPFEDHNISESIPEEKTEHLLFETEKIDKEDNKESPLEKKPVIDEFAQKSLFELEEERLNKQQTTKPDSNKETENIDLNDTEPDISEPKNKDRPEDKLNVVSTTPTSPIKPNANIPPIGLDDAEINIENPFADPVKMEEKEEENQKEFQLPDIDFLDPPKPPEGGYSELELDILSRQVEGILKDFKVIVEVVEIHPGPVVTMFELDLAPGTKASKVTGLSTDLARALSKTSVRVVEVIPGKSVIGLEIPNEKRDMVYLREIIESPLFKEKDSVLTLAMGKDIVGNPVVADLGKMPHALIAGTTGSGKSVAINTMILSLLYKATPREVRLIMVDPKMLELSVYDDIPHLLSPVVTDMEEAANSLRWAVIEMERRYKLMSAMGVRNLAGFNKIVDDAEEAGEKIPDPTWQPAPNATLTELYERPNLEHMPYIVIVIDELADMMMVVGKKVEELIARLAQKARAAGLHLLLATQRPSVDVITGLIKANVPSRLAFKVSSKIDSRTILDQMGAEALLGYGDSLFTSPANNIPMRTHGAFVDDHEVHKVANFLRSMGKPDYISNITEEPSEVIIGVSAEAAGVPETDSGDPLFNDAVQFVTESGKGSISSVQRRLKVGYNRAARMIEYMEELGIVSPPEHNGNRRVLVSPPPADET